jgi:hypothetical protein
MMIDREFTHRALQHRCSINSRAKGNKRELVSQPENIGAAYPNQTFTVRNEALNLRGVILLVVGAENLSGRLSF